MSDIKRGGIYVHIPYCKKKCLYCDFYSGGNKYVDWKIYVESILKELSSRKKEIDFIPVTLYFGGGTPSLMPEEYFQMLVTGMKRILNSDSLFQEITIEINPDDVTENKCKIWKESGVNRASVGIQSFVDRELNIIGRRHSANGAENAYILLKKYFDNISIDLIWGLPAQTLESWTFSINKSIDLNPQHISAYSLTLEEGTPLNLFIKNGKFILPSENEWIEMWYVLNDNFIKAGYRQYEISNFAKPGFESIHNLSYWTGKPYIGLGPAAHSYDGKDVRRWNPADLKTYLNFFSDELENGNAKTDPSSRPKFYEFERLTEKEKIEEFLMTRLRLDIGFNLNEFISKFGINEFKLLKKKIAPLIENKKLIEKNDNVFINQSFYNISNSIISSLF